jgi:hypothetical protein
LKFPASLPGFLAALRRQIHIRPAGKQILQIPDALAMAHQDKFYRHSVLPEAL